MEIQPGEDVAFSSEYSQKFLDAYGTLVADAAGNPAISFVAPLLKKGFSLRANEEAEVLSLTYSCIHEGPTPMRFL